MNPEQNQPTLWEKTKELAVQGIIVIAAILLVILVAWGIIKLVPAIISSVESGGASFTSLFKPSETLTVSATPQVASSGTPIDLSWKHVSRNGAGTYGISFVCAPGLSMKIRNSAGGFQTVPCGKSFPVGDVSAIVLAGTTTVNRLVQTTMTVTFTNTATGIAGVAGEIPLTITNDSLPFSSTSANVSPAASDSETPVAVSKPVATTSVKHYSGNPDLAISLISATADTIRFSVQNRGGSASGAWNFSTNINNGNGQAYSSPVEPSIGSGSGIIFTLSYGAANLGGANAVIIQINPESVDANSANNMLTVPLYGNGIGYVPTNYINYGGAGLPDLSVSILSVDGNQNPGNYYQNSYPYGSNISGNHVVRIQVSNIGGAQSGSWTYTAQLPISCQNIGYNNFQNGNSNVTCNGNQAQVVGTSQAPILPGGSVILTINFSNNNSTYGNTSCVQNSYPYNGYNSGCAIYPYNTNGGTFTFTANSYAQELRQDNNTATTYIQSY